MNKISAMAAALIAVAEKRKPDLTEAVCAERAGSSEDGSSFATGADLSEVTGNSGFLTFGTLDYFIGLHNQTM